MTTQTANFRPRKQALPGFKVVTVVADARLIKLDALQVGDEFQYHAASPDNWNKVTKVTEEKFFYQANGSQFEQSNHRHYGQIHVWVKDRQQIKKEDISC